MRVSFLISAAVHAAVLIFGVLPNVSSPERLEAEFSTADVSILSQDEWISMSPPSEVQFSEPVPSASVELPDLIPDESAPASALTLAAAEPELPSPALTTPAALEAPRIARPSLSAPEAPQLPRPEPEERPELQLAEPPSAPPAIALDATASLAVPPRPTDIPDAPPAPPVPEPAEEVRETPDADAEPSADDPALTAAPKVAPEAAPEPETDVKVGDEVQQATRSGQAADAEAAEAVDETTAPEHAATQIVTEAEETESEVRFAPARRPVLIARRPENPAEPPEDDDSETLLAARPEAAPEPESASESEDIDALVTAAAAAGESDLISELLTESISDGAERPESAEPLLALPSLGGSGLPSGVREGLRNAIAECWNVGALSSAALRTVVTIGFSLEQDGTPIRDTIRLVASDGESDVAVDKAFEAGQRAILCGLGKGHDLPLESYDRWRDVELTFDPEEMRLK